MAEFVDSVANELFLPAHVVGELFSGIERLRRRGDLDQARRIESWFESVTEEFSDRILPFDLPCALAWGKLMGINDQHPIDKQIAAIALLYDLIVVTRNIRHYEGTGVRTINPFLADRRLGEQLS